MNTLPPFTAKNIIPFKPVPQLKTGVSVNPVPVSTVYFGSKAENRPADNSALTVKTNGFVSKLFGSPLKNIGWGGLFGVAGVATFFVPPVSLSLLAVSGGFLVLALLQAFFTSTENKNESLDLTKAPAAAQSHEKMQSGLAKDVLDLIRTYKKGTHPKAAEKIWTLQLFLKDYEAMEKELPTTKMRFSQLSESLKEKLVAISFDSLTSDIPELVQWGREFSLGIGLDSQEIEKIIREHTEP